MYFVLKTLISALVIGGVSEIAKRSSLAGAILASLPLTSILAMIWLYRDTGDSQKVMDLSWGIFWVVIPSLLFFLLFPMLLKSGMRFWIAMPVSCLATAMAYAGYIWALRRLGVQL